MFSWWKKSVTTTPEPRLDEEAARRHDSNLSGTYRLLYKYLEQRYANTVVLSFAQIQDLLGFALPERARTDLEWWTATGAGPNEPHYSQAWRLARRTAKPNLLALNVVFERL